MPKKIVINTGFITNSSSCVYHFDKSLLEHPEVQAFLQAYEIDSGFVGEDLWDRGYCSSVILTDEQKEEAKQKFKVYDDYSHPSLPEDEDKGAIIFGDEYTTVASELVHILSQISETDEVQGEIKHTGYFN